MTAILTVCTGNICRSPAAQIALQGYLADADATITSAGTAALVDHGVPPEMARALKTHGLDASAHRARQLTPALATEADVIIAMTAEHRRRTVSETPQVLRRAFLLMEIAAAARAGAPIAGATPAERLANLGSAVQAYRPMLAGHEIPDVPDPYRRPQDQYDESTAMIVEACRDIAAWVEG